MNVRLDLLSGHRPHRRSPYRPPGSRAHMTWVAVGLWVFVVAWSVGEFNRYRKFEGAALRLERLRAREDREVAELEAMFELPDAVSWQRWTP